MYVYEETKEFRNEIEHLNKQGYQWIGDVYPITYGHVSPAGFAGKPDEKQQRFNRMVHLSQWPHDASKKDFENELVVHIPSDSVWCHWLAFGEFTDEFLAKNTDGMILHTLARFHKIVEAYGCDRQEFYARMLLHNEQADEEWLADYADRSGMTVESARHQIAEERKAITKSANGVEAASRATRKPRHPFSWYEARYEPYGEGFDPVDRNWKQSYECIREKIEREKAEREKSRKVISGLTIADMNAAGISYSDINDTESYRIDAETKEIIVIRTSTGKFLRGTGKYVARLLDGTEGKQIPVQNEAPKPKPVVSKPISAPETEKVAPTPKGVTNEPKKAATEAQPEPKKQPVKPQEVVWAPKEEFDPLKGVVNPRPKDKSGWKGTRKRRSCVTTRNAYDSAEGCLAIGAMYARR